MPNAGKFGSHTYTLKQPHTLITNVSSAMRMHSKNKKRAHAGQNSKVLQAWRIEKRAKVVVLFDFCSSKKYCAYASACINHIFDGLQMNRVY